jgi:mannose-6-phosphate isomerase-like protein (cupin superfamily)
MKHVLYSVLGFALILGLVQLVAAPQKKEARVTQVIKDVRLLASKGAPRPATLNDNVQEGTAVRTGSDSRAELTFSDETLTRLGANTVFSFSEGAREFDLSSGAILLAVPKSAGATRINTAAATAAVTGFTAFYESHANLSKFMVMEGHGTVTIKGSRDSCDLGPGQMIIIPRYPLHCPEILNFDIGKVRKSAKLITLFPPLPPWSLNLILAEEKKQEETGPPPGGYTDPTGTDKRDQDAATIPTPPTIIRPPATHPPTG